jgi:hypothetical protein
MKGRSKRAHRDAARHFDMVLKKRLPGPASADEMSLLSAHARLVLIALAEYHGKAIFESDLRRLSDDILDDETGKRTAPLDLTREIVALLIKAPPLPSNPPRRNTWRRLVERGIDLGLLPSIVTDEERGDDVMYLQTPGCVGPISSAWELVKEADLSWRGCGPRIDRQFLGRTGNELADLVENDPKSFPHESFTREELIQRIAHALAVKDGEK